MTQPRSNRPRATRRIASVVGASLLAVALPLLAPVDAHAETTATSYTFDRNPIDPAGTRNGGQTRQVTLTSKSGANPIGNANVYLYFTGSGSATVNSQCDSTSLAGTTAAMPATCTTDANGTLAITYTTSSTATSGTDTISAEGSPNGGEPTASTSYDYTTGGVYAFSDAPMAAPGSLAASAFAKVTITVNKSAQGETHSATANADQVFLSLAGTPTGSPTTGSANAYDAQIWTAASTCAAPPSTPLTNALQPQVVTLNANPQPIDYAGTDGATVIVCYQAPSPKPATGADVLTIQNKSSGADATKASDSYSYAGAAVGYAFSPAPIAPSGTLGGGQRVTVKVKPVDSTGAPIAGLAGVLLSAGLPSGATASVTECGSTTTLGATPVSCTSDSTGAVTVTYAAPSTPPTTGVDAITAQDAAASATATGTTGYSYGAQQAADYTFEPSPIAPSGSLAAGAAKSVTLTAVDTDGAIVPFTTVYLWEKQASDAGTASAVGCGALPTNQAGAIACATDQNGEVALTYTAPTTLPTTGEDAIEAQRESGATPAVGPISDDYSYAPVTQYAFSPSPIAPTATLGANQTVNVTITAKNVGGSGVNGAVVYLAITGLNGAAAGSAAVTQCGDVRALTATPVACTADTAGVVTVAYKTPSVVPAAGADTIRATSQDPGDGYSNPAVVGSDEYAYNALASYAFTPSPIAAPGSIPPGGSVPVTLTAKRADGSGIAGAKVFLSFSPATGAGTASVTQCGAVTSLSATPTACTADTSGKVAITYKAPSPATTAGTATITARDAATAAASKVPPATDTYTLLAKFGFQRLAGTDRYQTAAAIAKAAFPNGTASAVLTTGANFPDALAGAFLAGTETGGAPILLTDPRALPDTTKTALHDLHAGKVLVLGGTAAVSDDVVAELTAEGYTVTRIAGDTRYDTMKQLIDQRVAAIGVVDGKKTAILATGENFPDALGAGPLSYGKHLPIVLTNGKRSSLLPQARDTLTSAHIAQVIIVGGTGAISPGINAELQKMGITIIEQAAGQNRSETSALLATWAVGHKLASANAIAVANGCRPDAGAAVVPCFTPDALSGAPFGGSQSSPIPTLITLSPTDAGDVTTYAHTNKATLQVGHVYGGTGAVADSTLQAIAAAAGG